MTERKYIHVGERNNKILENISLALFGENSERRIFK